MRGFSYLLNLTSLWALGLQAESLGASCHSSDFDFIIVGGGTAGLAMFNRLSSSGRHSVLVVEAGSFYEPVDNKSTVPGNGWVYYNTSVASSVSLYDWGFVTTPQSELQDKQFRYSRGKTLGGSSAENAMIYQRGTKQSFARFADEVGDASYTWDSLLPFFRKSVHFTLENVKRPPNSSVPEPSSESYDAIGGPVQVSHPDYAMPWGSWARHAMHEVGIPETRDFSNGNLLGSQWAPETVNPVTSERSSSQTSYLSEVMKQKRGNVCVLTDTLAQKIVFDDSGCAIGIEVSRSGMSRVLYSNKEVIVSAGAFQSPQLLMVSGIGPSEALQANNITVIVDSKGVGQNLVDHVFFPISYPAGLTTKQSQFDPIQMEAFVAAYKENRTGLLTTSGEDFIGWEKAQNRSLLSANAQNVLGAYPIDWPELEFIAGSVPNGMLPSKNHDYAQIYVAIVAPSSRGTIAISSPSMEDSPLINPAWFSNSTDVELAVAGFRRAREIFAASSLDGILTGPEVLPGLQVQTDAQIRDFIKQQFLTLWHAAGTCKMGRTEDTTSVVDSKARVIGVQGLRVVDASILPFLPPGHPQSIIYALAEKISDEMNQLYT